MGRQVTEDIAYYRGSADCDHRVCFVYDPEHRIANPVGLAHDLEKNAPADLEVRVVIAPTP
jgi:hypothetical protein